MAKKKQIVKISFHYNKGIGVYVLDIKDDKNSYNNVCFSDSDFDEKIINFIKDKFTIKWVKNQRIDKE